jgi:hypothetical protein
MSNHRAITQSDIDSAKMVSQWANGWPEHNPNRIYERLFRTQDGRFFLAVEQGGEGTSKIVVLGIEEARPWVHEHCDKRTFTRLFG